ncbi:hypothetical protein QBC35DRAFT_493094 [Podospora australis]|uniref:NADH-ubiquinone oxidoreductase B15 subunit n=1 Tax=Podospora australis TaxID=1536484 RepID=A0AAN6WZZ6_9PEZI|nr:hypothetical protein QBC35DRAFT_493094 [Podospora australis]
MAGLEHHKLALDPALVRVANTIQNRYKYFRFSPRTGMLTFVYVAVVPFMVGYLGWTTDGKYDLRAKRRGDVIVER